ncbi:hypothetical protein GIB67_006217 [Kingdonia uniflora]|uniref:Uncharacterized protein n=1 Tax=Kingdonia uniflora TaxID=39325 RepID=A0A7J7P545_9MAGN|nr:hypothetical protein GIB67_006217 [Kingdonia uniflora]
MQRISEGAVLDCTAHTFFRRFETTRQYPDEKADSRVRMKVQPPRTSAGNGEVKIQKIESLQSRDDEGSRRGRRDYFKCGRNLTIYLVAILRRNLGPMLSMTKRALMLGHQGSRLMGYLQGIVMSSSRPREGQGTLPRNAG